MNIINHFMDNMKTVLVTKWNDFNSRSARPEYWYFCLYATLVALVCMATDYFVIGYTFFSMADPFGTTTDSGVLTATWILVTFIQSLALNARRLHDRGHSGWWQLMLLVPVLNFIVIYWLVRSAKDTPKYLKYKNPYGKLPK
jgi:uncharacterized membrane protein YhaH (DUF805 family)